MSKFYRDYLSTQELSKSRTTVKLADCLKLIENSEFKDDLLILFDFEKIKNGYVNITGLKKVIESVILRDQEYQKLDLESHISDVTYVSIFDANTVILKFNNPESIEEKVINAKTVYSAKKEYFEGSYKIDKFANFCIKEGHSNLLKDNIEYLNQQYKDSNSHIKSFRLLKNTEGNYFLRAITSTSQYYDYNIRFSLFVTIVTIYGIIKSENYNFIISRCEYSESFIRLYLQKDRSVKIPNVGTLSFVLEMSNDEIKREAFKFSALFTLNINSNTERVNVFLKPKKLKTKLISIKHNFKPDSISKPLGELSTFIKEAEKEMMEDITELNNVKNPDHLRYFLLRKIERSNNKELLQFKPQIRETLDVKIFKISELLVLMSKVDGIVTDLEVKEYLRYSFYEILRSKKSNRN